MIASVIFKENGKPYDFDMLNFQIDIGNKVVVETEKGLQYGKVVKLLSKKTEKNYNDMKQVVRIATEDDENKYMKNLRDANLAVEKAKKIVQELSLDMTLLDASYTFDRKQLLFNFISENRVDFRELAKKLASVYKTRIELRQIGIRDKAREVGGIGQCGRKICCASFLNRIDAVTINMAKNQNIALNPTKINGVCGRLLCCLAYEDQEYSDCHTDLPNVGSRYSVDSINGIVKSVDVLNRKIEVDTGSELKTIELGFNNDSNK